MIKMTIHAHLSSGLKTIAQASLEVADTLIMLAKGHPDFQKMTFISQKKNEVFDFLSYDRAEDLAKELSVAYIKSKSGEIRKYNKGLKVVTEDFSEDVGFRYWFVYKKSKDDDYSVIFKLGSTVDGIRNQIDIELPEDELNTCQWAKGVLCNLIDYFDVTYGGLLPWYFLKYKHKLYRHVAIYPGWISYFPNEAELPDMSDYEAVEDYKDKGKIYTLQNEEFDLRSQVQCRKWLCPFKKFAVKFGIPE